MLKTRIVHLITGLGVGGAETLLLSTLRHLSRTEFDVYVVCLYNPGIIAQKIEGIGIPVIDIGMRSFADPAGILRLTRTLKGLHPDLLHTHLFRANQLGRVVGTLLGIPVIVSSEHSLTKTHFEGREHAWWLSRIDSATARLCDAVVGVSEATCQQLARHGLSTEKIVHIPNAIDTSLYVGQGGTSIRRELGLDGAKVVTVVGRLVPQKNHSLLLSAFRSVLKRIPQARLLVVGDGPLLASLKSLAAFETGSAVLFLGTREDIPAILAASDICVLPSRWEPFGLAIVEAMASGVPVIGTNVDGIPELIRHGVTGLIVPPESEAALSDAICSLLSDSTSAKAMGQAAQRDAKRFDIRFSAAVLQDLYRRLRSSPCTE